MYSIKSGGLTTNFFGSVLSNALHKEHIGPSFATYRRYTKKSLMQLRTGSAIPKYSSPLSGPS